MRRYGRYHRHYHGGDSDGLGCLALILLGIFALPVIGIYQIITGNEEEKTTGAGLLIIGLIIWVIIAIAGH